MAKEHYKRYDPTTGEIYWITPEFNLMSRGGRKGKRNSGHMAWKHTKTMYTRMITSS